VNRIIIRKKTLQLLNWS